MCGIIGISGNSPAVSDLYNGLLILQHRGQDATGIVTYDTHFHIKKDNGLVTEVIKPEDSEILTGNIGIGQVRYRTTGSLDPQGAQPFFLQYPFGIALIHNGNLTNYKELKDKVVNKYSRYLNSDSDTELIIHTLSQELTKTKDIFTAVSRTMSQLKGSYSIITLIGNVGSIAFRDPYAIRPLIYGRRKNHKGYEYMFASESVALISLGFEIIDDVQPGEAIMVDMKGKLTKKQCIPRIAKKPCIFEYVYLARPDSMIDDISVYKSRLRMGERLATQIIKAGIKVDVVIPIPDTARSTASSLANKLKVPYREGLVKNRYVGRTFIMPGQAQRKKSIKQKLNPIEIEIRKKNVLLVDDSIVRGNTSEQIVAMVREAGAKKVYFASAAPAITNPCVYGVDIPTRKELIAHNRNTQAVAKAIGADGVFYQTIEDLIAAASEGSPKTNEFCTGCMNRDYSTPEVTEKLLKEVEKSIESRMD